MAIWGMRRDLGGFKGIRSMCRRIPGGGWWHGRVGRGCRKGRRRRWVRKRMLALDFCP